MLDQAWKLDPQRARRAEIVLALQQGVVVGVFVAERWMPASVLISRLLTYHQEVLPSTHIPGVERGSRSRFLTAQS